MNIVDRVNADNPYLIAYRVESTTDALTKLLESIQQYSKKSGKWVLPYLNKDYLDVVCYDSFQLKEVNYHGKFELLNKFD